jgi:hypothetical protein
MYDYYLKSRAEQRSSALRAEAAAAERGRGARKARRTRGRRAAVPEPASQNAVLSEGASSVRSKVVAALGKAQTFGLRRSFPER